MQVLKPDIRYIIGWMDNGCLLLGFGNEIWARRGGGIPAPIQGAIGAQGAN